MRVPISTGILCLTLAAACAADNSITHGADGKPEWDRRLAAAIPIGIPVDSARAIMLESGFHCGIGADSVRHLSCDKDGGGRFAIVRRRWRAVLDLDTADRVQRVRATTSLTGP